MMRIRVLGGGWYGAHIALDLIEAGHAVELHEKRDVLFAGASGANPARCHLGFHYPRSGLTQAACQEHAALFMQRYGHLTRGVPVNVYAVAAGDSLVDFTTYTNGLRGRVEFVSVYPDEHGLMNCEGAVLTGERHVVIGRARNWFTQALAGHLHFGQPQCDPDDKRWDMTIDCTFCANDAENIDRFEPCVMGLLRGPTDKAVTIMDGPFPSIYPWNESLGLSSITSASLTPLTKTERTYQGANGWLTDLDHSQAMARCDAMLDQMMRFWPEAGRLYKVVDYKLAVRAMPRSAADARLVDVVRVGERTLRVRAGKIDAIFHAARIIREVIDGARDLVKQMVLS